MRRAVPTDRLEGLLGGERGLSAAEAATRIARYGFNDIVEKRPNAWRELARDTLRDPMLWFLLATATLFGVLGDRAEAITLTAAILPLIGMDAYLHRRTQASTRGLQSRLADRAHVLRDGSWQEIPARDLVPGDLVEVGAGQPFPADGILLAGEALQVDESMLTGESLPVRKQPCPPQAKIGTHLDDMHWASAGTRLLTGRARLRIACTGRDTLYGEIVRLALQGTRARTPLQSAIARLVAVLLLIAALMCIVLAVIRWLQGHGIADALLSAITLAVAAIPEEFPVVFTFFLGAGVYRLAKRRALVRRAVAVENIGRVTCICSDKTGTMTEGRLVLAHRAAIDDVSEARLVECALLAARDDSGDPLDLALHDAAAPPAWAGERTAIFPFTEARRRECALWRLP
ncbi:MAG TPA: HAD-IC family P-type ATPase, partial [Acetobacteraceae bacterium]|nr:HAD-IC family P-type ATPase [Acetobacteraceae bacterium]